MGSTNGHGQLGSLIEHFTSSHRSSLLAALDAMKAGEVGAFEKVVERVSKSKLVASVQTLVNTAGDGVERLLGEVERVMGSSMWGFFAGAAIAAMGGMLYAGAAVASPKLAAVVLMVIGICIAFSAVREVIQAILDGAIFKGVSGG